MTVPQLVLMGYAIAAIATLFAFTQPWPRRRTIRWDLVFLAMTSTAAATLLLVRHAGREKPVAAQIVYAPLLAGQVVLLGTSVWLVASVCLLVVPRKLKKRPPVDFSFLTLETPPDAVSQSNAPRPGRKINHRRWVDRLSAMRMLHRWSFLTDPPP